MAGTYCAQAREYRALSGSFAGQDKILGFMERPYTLNQYAYCFNRPINLVDLNGAWPQWMEDIGNGLKDAGDWIGNKISDVARWFNDEIWSKHIYGEDTILYEQDLFGNEYQVVSHRGGSLIVAKRNQVGEFKGWTINAEVTLPGNITVGSELSGESLDPSTWKFSQGSSIEYKNHTYKYGWFFDKKGVGINSKVGGDSGNMPLPLPDGTEIEDYANITWSYSSDIYITNWKQVFEAVSVVAAVALLAILVADDSTGIGVIDDPLIGPVVAYIAKVAPSLYQFFVDLVPKLATCGG